MDCCAVLALQVELLDDVNLVLILENASDAKIRGHEIELEGKLSSYLTAYATASFLDTEYDNYVSAFSATLDGPMHPAHWYHFKKA